LIFDAIYLTPSSPPLLGRGQRRGGRKRKRGCGSHAIIAPIKRRTLGWVFNAKTRERIKKNGNISL
jgi:hypothetical protein